MEPPPGPCSSPPGPRPVPPPRKGSMERRPLSPSRRGSELSGAWDAASDANARGSKPGTPERAVVTQRVLIVMQSHANPPPSAVPIQGPPPPDDLPITSWGATPRTSQGGQETSLPETTPISWGAPPTPRTSQGGQETSLPETTPISWGAPPTPRTSQGGQETSPPESTPITSEVTSLYSPAVQSWGASSPPTTAVQSWGASSPPTTAVQSWGASSPPTTAVQSWGASSPPTTAVQSWGASSPPTTAVQSWGASSPPTTAVQSWGASSPPTTAVQSWGASSPPTTAVQNWGEPPRTSQGGLETSPPESTPITSVATSLPERTPTLSTPILKQGTSPVQDQWAQPTQSTGGVESYNAEIQIALKDTHRGSELENTAMTHGELLSNVTLQDLGGHPSMAVQTQLTARQHSATQSQVVSPLADVETRGRLPQIDMLEHASGVPPDYTGAQDCTATHERLSSQQGVGTQMSQDRGIQDTITRNLRETGVTLPNNASPSVTPLNVTVRPEEAKSAVTVRPEEAKSAVTVRPEEAKSAVTVRPEEAKSAVTVRPEEAKSAVTVRPEEAKSAVTVRPEEAKSAVTVRPEEAKIAVTVRPEEAKSAVTVRPEEAKSAVTVRPEEAKSAVTVRPEEAKSAVTVRPEEAKSAVTVRPEEAKSTTAVRLEEAKCAAAMRLEEAKSAAAMRLEEAKSAVAVRLEEAKSAVAVRLEEAKSVAAVRPEDMKSTSNAQSNTTVLPNLITQQEVQQKQDGSPMVGNITQTQESSNSQSQISSLPTQPSQGWSSLSPIRVPDPSSPHRHMFSKPPLPIPPRSNLYPSHPLREQETSASHETASLSSLKSKAPAPDTLSYLDSVSLMSGTMESLTILDDASSIGSDSEINGMPYRKTDKYGFLGGNQYSGNGETAIPVEIARQRELKWLEMFSNWDKWLLRRFQKVKLRCRKGIPSSLRAKAWQFLCNGHELLTKNPGKFEVSGHHNDVVEEDLLIFVSSLFSADRQQDLYRILKAYTVYRPEEGYCQAQAPVAAVLLMHMPAEQAFWCLVQICDKYLPGYYSAGLEAIQLDGEIFFALLRRICPMAYRHLKKFKIDPILYMTEWFMCIFSRTLPWASVLRVWDMFFCEGVKIVFRVGLVLLKHTLGSVDKLRSCQGMYETMEKLRSLPVHCMQEDILLPEVSSLPVTDALIERESNTQLRKWRENRGELQYRPSRRLHGAKQIYEEKARLNPTLSGSRLSLSSMRRPSPPATPALAVQPESVVVSEGLRPALPSPTSNKAPLGPPRGTTKKGKEKQREQDKKREREERDREKKREKEDREERRKEKEREKHKEKEEKRLQKEREKVETRQKKERKFSFRRKESSTPDSPRNSGAEATESSAAHDTYF
ncbi:TBC1 domain family member 10B-like [Eleutherodactylus coqui]